MPEPQQADVVQQFQALPRDRQISLLGKMTPDQKQKLNTAIQARVKTPKPGGASGSWEPDKSLASRAESAVDKFQVDVPVGIVKSIGQDVSTVAKQINKIPKVGEDLAPKEGIAALDKMTQPKGFGENVGAGLETAGEYAIGEGTLKEFLVAAKLGQSAKVAAMVKKYPKIAEAAKGFALATMQATLHGQEHPVTAGVWQAGFGMASAKLGEVLDKMGTRSASKAVSAVNRYLGLKMTNIPKWERGKDGMVESIGKTVLGEVGIKPTLKMQKDAIEATRSSLERETATVLAGAPSRTIPIDAVINDAEKTVAAEIKAAGTDYHTRLDSLKEQVADMKQNIFGKGQNPHISPQQALDIRRNLTPKFTDPAEGALPQVNHMLHNEIYKSLNDNIEKALPADAAKTFKENSAVQHRLIIAREAVGAKIDNMELGKNVVDPITRAKSVAKRAVAGAVGGAVFGAIKDPGHVVRDATIGAASVGASGLKGESIPEEKVPGNFGKLAAAAPRLVEIAKKSPAIARAVQSVLAAHGGGSGSISAP